MSIYRTEIRELVRLATPLAAAQAGTQLMSLVDVAVVGRLGATPLAATGLANVMFFAISVVGMGIMFGVDPLISQAIGAKDSLRAHRVLWQGLWLSLLVTAVLTVPMLLAPLILPIAGVEPELHAPATTYLYIRTIGLAPFLAFLVFRAYLQARGVTRPMLTAMIACNVFNLIFDIWFVFGGAILPEWTGPLRLMPAMGIAGAALATVLGSLLQLAIVMRAALRIAPVAAEGGGAPLRRWNGTEVAQAFRVGFPLGIQLGAEVGIFALVGLLAGRLGTRYLAAHQTVIALASFTYTVALGIASAGAVRVGLAVGARDVARTRAAGRAALLAGAAFMSIPALAFIFVPEALARIITTSPEVIATTIPLFVVAAFFQLSDGVQAVGAGVLRGAGDTKHSLVANLIGHWGIGLPLALLLGFGRSMGIVGLWWGLCAGLTVVAVFLFARFERLSAKPIQPLAVMPAGH
jgi:MATE family multidrug resistance protein